MSIICLPCLFYFCWSVVQNKIKFKWETWVNQRQTDVGAGDTSCRISKPAPGVTTRSSIKATPDNNEKEEGKDILLCVQISYFVKNNYSFNINYFNMRYVIIKKCNLSCKQWKKRSFQALLGVCDFLFKKKNSKVAWNESLNYFQIGIPFFLKWSIPLVFARDLLSLNVLPWVSKDSKPLVDRASVLDQYQLCGCTHGKRDLSSKEILKWPQKRVKPPFSYSYCI